MEHVRPRDPIDLQQASLQRTELSAELQEHVPEACFFCPNLAFFKMRLATRSAMRGEMSSDQAILEFDKLAKECPGLDEFRVCRSKSLRD